MSLHTWLAWMVACWVISLSPGAGAVASMTNGLNHGFKRGYWNVLGLELGLIVQIVIVAAGAGVAFATHPFAFHLVKWFGVFYLLYLAYKQWVAKAEPLEIKVSTAPKTIQQIVLQGFLVNISNPKAMVFLLAIFPQFIDLNKPQWIQYTVMTLTIVVIDCIVMAGYTGLAVKILSLLKSSKQQRYVNRTFSSLFIVASTYLATLKP